MGIIIKNVSYVDYCEGPLSSSYTPKKRSAYKTILAWIFAFFFVISAIGVIFTFFPVGKLLNPQFYQQAMQDVNIYQRLPETIAKQLAVNLTPTVADSDSGISLMVLSDHEWETILVDLIDPGWLQSQSEQVIDQVFDLLLVSQDPLNTPIEISVAEIKHRFAGPEGIQAVNQIIEAQPPCSLEQLLGLVQIGLGMENTIGSILCRPPDFILSEINPFVESFLATTVGQIPDEIPFYIPISQLESQTGGKPLAAGPGEIPEPLQILRRVNTMVSWSPLLPLIFLFLMTLVAVRSLKDFMAWWGGALFASGSISLIFSAIMVPVVSWAFSTYLPMDIINLIDMPELLVSIGITDLYDQLVNQLQLSIIIPAVIMTVIGFALLLGLFLLSRISPKMQPQPSITPNEHNSD